MSVALTYWGNRISPVFDSANTLLIVDIENGGRVKNRRYEYFNAMAIFRLAEVFHNFGIEVLICGAISEVPARIFEYSGIKLIPFIGGNVEQILDSYANGIQIVPKFLMPGCGRKHGQKRKANNLLNEQKKENIMPKGDGTGQKGQGAGKGRGKGGCKSGKGNRSSGQGKVCGNQQGRGQKGNN